MMALAQMVHDAQLVRLVHERHHTLVDVQVLEILGLDLVLHVHQCVAQGVDVVLTHAIPRAC